MCYGFQVSTSNGTTSHSTVFSGSGQLAFEYYMNQFSNGMKTTQIIAYRAPNLISSINGQNTYNYTTQLTGSGIPGALNWWITNDDLLYTNSVAWYWNALPGLAESQQQGEGLRFELINNDTQIKITETANTSFTKTLSSCSSAIPSYNKVYNQHTN